MIVNKLVHDIRTGVYPPGAKLPGHKKLAYRFNVSSITAERALAELLQMGLIERWERAGSYVLEDGRVLSRVFVVVQSDMVDRWLPQLQEYWRAVLNEAGVRKLPVQTLTLDDANFDVTIGIAGYCGQGLVFIGSIPEQIASAAARASIPCVYVGRAHASKACCVLEDRRTAARELVATMIEDGCRRIGFVGKLAYTNHQSARDGYLEGIADLGLGYRYIRDADPGNLVAVMRDLLAADLDLDAVIVMGGRLPLAAMPVILETKGRVKMGCLAEDPGILYLGAVAYIAYYSQAETGKLAFKTLYEIASGQITQPEVRYTDSRILRPGETLPDRTEW